MKAGIEEEYIRHLEEKAMDEVRYKRLAREKCHESIVAFNLNKCPNCGRKFERKFTIKTWWWLFVAVISTNADMLESCHYCKHCKIDYDKQLSRYS